ncbi:MAG: SAF domain-containing protein [Pseudonocardiaceae bacterium]
MSRTSPPGSVLARVRALAHPDRRGRGLGRRYPRSVHLRRIAAALMFGLAIVLAVLPTRAGGEHTTPMVVTSRDLAAGSPITAADLRMVAAPPALVPSGALPSVDVAVGRMLASSARAGEPLTDARLVGVDDARGHGSDAAVPIRLADAGVADLLYPGAKVDVVTLGSGEQARRVLARNATVVTVTAAQNSGSAASSGRLVLIAVPVDTATLLAAASLNQPVTVTLR